MNDEARRTLAAIASTSVPPSWRQMTMPSLFSAATSGVIAWIVCVFCAPNPNAPVEKLEVGSLVVTDRLVVRANGNDGDAMLVKDGSLFVKNRVVATQFLGAQIAGSIIVANRQLTTPDDIFKVPADKWRFFTEIGATTDAGGEVIVRSRTGASSVAKNMDDGTCIRIGFDASETTQVVTYCPKSDAMQTLLAPRTRRPDSTRSETARSETVPPPIVAADTAPQFAAQFTPPTTPTPSLPTLAPPIPILPPLR